jgi:hypothetical protein
VIFMLLAFLLVVGLITACAVAAWSNLRSFRGAGKPANLGAPGAASALDRSPQTLEGVLAGQLMTGEITGPQYQHAMATLAARDAERHPLEVPPDISPPEAA